MWTDRADLEALLSKADPFYKVGKTLSESEDRYITYDVTGYVLWERPSCAYPSRHYLGTFSSLQAAKDAPEEEWTMHLRNAA